MKIQSPNITSGSITGSLLGTSSYAISSSYALTGSHSLTSRSSSFAITSSYALNSGFALKIQEDGADFVLAASNINFTGNSVNLTGGGSSATVNINQQNGVERVTKIDFDYTTNTTLSTPVTFQNGGAITRIQVVKHNIFNGTNPRARITIPNFVLMETGSIVLTSSIDDVIFKIKPIAVTNVGNASLIFTHTGSTAGSATAYIFYVDNFATT